VFFQVLRCIEDAELGVSVKSKNIFTKQILFALEEAVFFRVLCCIEDAE
jgi:hypothetical protein